MAEPWSIVFQTIRVIRDIRGLLRPAEQLRGSDLVGFRLVSWPAFACLTHNGAPPSRAAPLTENGHYRTPSPGVPVQFRSRPAGSDRLANLVLVVAFLPNTRPRDTRSRLA